VLGIAGVSTAAAAVDASVVLDASAGAVNIRAGVGCYRAGSQTIYLFPPPPPSSYVILVLGRFARRTRLA
jgi:hypothetical protein